MERIRLDTTTAMDQRPDPRSIAYRFQTILTLMEVFC